MRIDSQACRWMSILSLLRSAEFTGLCIKPCLPDGNAGARAACAAGLLHDRLPPARRCSGVARVSVIVIPVRQRSLGQRWTERNRAAAAPAAAAAAAAGLGSAGAGLGSTERRAPTVLPDAASAGADAMLWASHQAKRRPMALQDLLASTCGIPKARRPCSWFVPWKLTQFAASRPQQTSS